MSDRFMRKIPGGAHICLILILLFCCVSLGRAAKPRSSQPMSVTIAPVVIADEAERLKQSVLTGLEFNEMGLKFVGTSRTDAGINCQIKHPGSTEEMVYATGDVIGGYRIISIGNDSILFERDGREFGLDLDGEEMPFDLPSEAVLVDVDSADKPLTAAVEEEVLVAAVAIPTPKPVETPIEVVQVLVPVKEDRTAGALSNNVLASLKVVKNKNAKVVESDETPVPTPEPVLARATKEVRKPETIPGANDGKTNREMEKLLAQADMKKERPSNRARNNKRELALKRESNSSGESSREIASANTSTRVEFTSPLKGGKFTSDYGYRRHPIGGDRRFHRGVDLAAPSGTSVSSAADGVVVSSQKSYALGLHIVVKHSNGFETVYAHLSSSSVKPGQRVKCGQAIGGVGSSGYSTGPHLHFEVHRNGQTLNPKTYVPGLR